MLLCVPILDGGGTVRGFCGAEISDLYFSLSHNTVPSAFGNMLTLAAPIDGDSLLLSGAMLGTADGSRLTANGILHISDGKYYTTPLTAMGKTPIWGGTSFWMLPRGTASPLPL